VDPGLWSQISAYCGRTPKLTSCNWPHCIRVSPWTRFVRQRAGRYRRLPVSRCYHLRIPRISRACAIYMRAPMRHIQLRFGLRSQLPLA